MIQLFNYLHNNVLYLNSSKFFAGVMMILLNIGSKFIPITFSKSTEQYLKWSISKQILIFTMAWMGTRDIYSSLVLTAVFIILSDNLFNEDSEYCIVPEQYRVLKKLIDTNNDNIISDEELQKAKEVLMKSEDIKKKKIKRITL
jgi:hypothetical protein